MDGPTEVVTPTLLTRNVIGKLREADAKANTVLKEMGKSQLGQTELQCHCTSIEHAYSVLFRGVPMCVPIGTSFV